MRCKMRVVSITDFGTRKDLVLSPVIGKCDENAMFWKCTPSGEVRLSVDNLPAVDGFRPGQEYYLDFILAS